MFRPSSGKLLLNPVSPEIPWPSGPRQHGQSNLPVAVDGVVDVRELTRLVFCGPAAFRVSFFGTRAAAGITARIHVIGFDVGENERQQLECIAKAGNGLYLTASNTDELHAAVAQVTQTVAEAEPAWVEIFRDDFDGDYLSEDWEVLNPNPDNYIVEDGSLLTVTDKE